MTAQHSPEPWKVHTWPGYGEIVDNAVAVLCAVRRDGSAQDEHGWRVTAADARRIVACVNACSGIPTEELELCVGDEDERLVFLAHRALGGTIMVLHARPLK